MKVNKVCAVWFFAGKNILVKKFFVLLKKVLTSRQNICIIINVVAANRTAEFAGVAQLVEQLICNQQVGGSNPSTSSSRFLTAVFLIREISRAAKWGRL